MRTLLIQLFQILTISSILWGCGKSAPNPTPGISTAPQPQVQVAPPPTPRITIQIGTGRFYRSHFFSNYAQSSLSYWLSQARTRSSSNPSSMRAINLSHWGSHTTTIGTAETIMAPSVAIKFIRSLDLLEARYPFAIPNSDRAMPEIMETVQQFNESGKSDGPLIKAAALRFLQRMDDFHIASHSDYQIWKHSPDNDRSGGLTIMQLLALSWAAANDLSIYNTEALHLSKTWEMIQAYARIQRAHNEDRNNLIFFDPNIEQDRISCPVGTFIRSYEPLHESHPDVALYRPSSGDLVPTPSELGLALQTAHETLFPQKNIYARNSIRLGMAREDIPEAAVQGNAPDTVVLNTLPPESQAAVRYVYELRNWILAHVDGSTHEAIRSVSPLNGLVRYFEYGSDPTPGQ